MVGKNIDVNKILRPNSGMSTVLTYFLVTKVFRSISIFNSSWYNLNFYFIF